MLKLAAVVLVVLFVLLSGCAKQPVSETTQTSEFVIPASWQVSGKLSLSMPDEQLHGRFIWQQQPQGFLLRLSDPIGRTLLELSQYQQEVILTTSDEMLKHEGNASAFLYHQTGLLIPVEDLPFWFWGQVNPEAEIEWVESDVSENHKAFNQGEWTIQLQKYASNRIGEGELSLPKKVTITNHQFKLRLAINKRKLTSTK